MPTIRITTTQAECVYDADRVVRDSESLVVESRRDRTWVRVGSFAAADVLGVHRFVPRDGEGIWITEDVRFGAGLSPPADSRPTADLPRPRRLWRRRSRGAT